MWADGVHPKVRLGQAHSCVLVLMGVRPEGRKELIALPRGCVNRPSRARICCVIAADAACAIPNSSSATARWACGGPSQRYFRRPGTRGAGFTRFAKSAQPGAKKALQEIYNAEDRDHAEKAIKDFERAYGAKWPKATKKVTDEADELLAFYDFPAEHWVHLRTTNPIESTFSTVKLRTKVTRGAGSPAAALAMVFKLVESAQARWRAITAPHLVALVRNGARFKNGHLVERPEFTAA